MNSLSNYGVLWDLDGVLVDSGELHFLSWSEVMQENDIPFSYEFFRDTFGMNNAGVLTRLLGEPPTPELLWKVAGRKEELFRELLPGRVKVLPGARDWLARLRRWGVRQALATSAPAENMEALVDEAGLRSYLDALVTGFDLPSKPDPAVYLKAAEQIGVAPAQCVVVEDAVPGVEGARRAGMRCIAVTTTNPAGALQAADIVVDRLSEVSDEAFRSLLTA